MRNILIISIVILLGFSSFAQDKEAGFTVKYTLTNLKDGPVKLVIYRNNEPFILDSTVSVNGAFTFKGKVSVAEFVYTVFANSKTYLPFFVENAEMLIKGDYMKLDQTSITGSKTNREYQKVMAELDVFKKLTDESYAKYQEAQNMKDEKTMAIYDSILNQINDNKMKALYEIAFTQNKSVVAPYIVVSQLIYYIETSMLDSIVKNFDKSIDASEYVKILKERLRILKSVDVGQIAPEITMADTAGVPFSLSSLRGKVVLIDFWASWCRPCRAENPNVVAAYKAFKDKGFDILGVSLDKSKENWIAAIKKDNLSWHHVSDLKYWSNAAGKLYGVNSIPHSVLIDKDGRIVANSLRGDDLLKKLAELLH